MERITKAPRENPSPPLFIHSYMLVALSYFLMFSLYIIYIIAYVGFHTQLTPFTPEVLHPRALYR